ncbi:MAG: restriction endonuclease subunit S [Armatimonadota bacterium]|nr:restriction endonuclease subunit S [Armatimonadota bacterium]MDR7444688.1 restriction endonuclease subunit S [Armatimonadota bacterium]MDR7569190.1 restriction endonuclease subunit S [Armatimonadota bacterium]MDR7613308.1 restriction endonuclease subunit S [Armatimonadota bacterium]
MTEGPYKLPEGWQWVRLGEVCTINPRRPRIQREESEPTTFVPMSAVDDATGEIVAAEERPFAEVRKGYTYFEENDVLFAKITPCMENGKAAIARCLRDGIGFGSTEFHVLRPGESIISEWIWLFVRQECFREEAKKAFRGGVGQQRVPQEFLEQHPIPLPPLPEQRRIVARIEELMARVREARRLREEALEDAERLWQATLAETFPRPDVGAHGCAPLPEGWRWVRLGEVCEINPRRPRMQRAPNASTTFVPMSAVDDETGTIVAAQERPYEEVRKGYTYFEENDILFAKITPCMENGKAAIARGLINSIGFGSTEFHVLRPGKNVIPEWIWLFIRQERFRKDAKKAFRGGVGQQRVPQEFLEQYLVPLPPLEEQRRIVAHLEAVQERVRALKEAQAATEAELQRLEQAILDKAFRGEL